VKNRGFLLLALLLLVPAAFADEFRPAYLQLTQTASDRYEVLWKVPALDETTVLKVQPVFPNGTLTTKPLRSSFASGAVVQRWSISVPGGLEGRPIEFPGVTATRIDILVRLVRSDGTVQLARIFPASPTFIATGSPRAFEVMRTYTVLGIEHILTGFDHLLFVLALVILVKGVRRLIATITAFTLAHSLSLVAATLGWVHVPGPPVEACIALSIVFVAGEIMHSRAGQPGITERYPWLVAFTFGLLHGLGFASALAEVGLPPLSIPIALFFFNVGVEIGQLLFIAAIFAVIGGFRWAARRLAVTAPSWAWRIPPYAIGGVASYWVLERVSSF
jgi:hydrogenase/urease accessory protein HupE